MLFKTLLVSTLLVAVQATAEPAPYKIGSMSLNTAFGLLKRQAGYQPTQTFCGPGSTCPESCGADFVQCPSSDGDLHCFEPSLKENCCPDGTGNSCAGGYYCTSDASGGSWCCPDGMDLKACAAAYSLTGSLVSEIASTTTTRPLPASSTPAKVSTSSSSSSSSSVPVSTTSRSPYPTSTTSSSVLEKTKTSSAASTSTSVVRSTATVSGGVATSSLVPVQVTAGANAKVVPGLLLLAGALAAF